MYPEKFEDLIAAFRRLPGVGQKTAERYAYAVMGWDEKTQKQFIEALKGLKDIHHCPVCGNMTDQDKCSICSDETRDSSTICVVQNTKDLAAIEQIQNYNGVYHVLNGLINIKKGIMPDHLNIPGLEKRISDQTEEIILALDPSIEGETTSLYIEKLLKDKVKITRLAYGIPVGGQLDYADPRTLEKALEGRR
ncbi:MAG: recombination protein RecR [Erysipelotrichaceae bacterium]|nr:recombination protein RecR [Erysipelotrichaceae bacterium]